MEIESLKGKVNPQHTALVIVDMQRDFCCAGGVLDKLGFDIEAPNQLAATLNGFLNRVRKILKFIVHIKMTQVPELRSPALVEQYSRAGLERQYDPRFSEFYQVVPLENEIVIPKYRYSGFVSTYLDRYLRANQIKTLVVTGVATNVCVESTIRDGFMRDYAIVVPRDMTEGTTPEAKEWSLKTIDTFFGEVVESSDLLRCWLVE
jgi:ureidoacrylate peracid hydrolase